MRIPKCIIRFHLGAYRCLQVVCYNAVVDIIIYSLINVGRGGRAIKYL